MLGRDFEDELSREFGLEKVPGSGNQWHSKLDLKGRGFRWSLKSTSKDSFSIKKEDIDEAIRACFGQGGDSSIPLWAFRVGDREHDMIMMRKEDFISMQNGDMQKAIETDKSENVKKRKYLASVPKFLRDE